MTDQPRLFADYAALPTARDRALRRTNAERHQTTMFDTIEPDADACPVCTGPHPEADCDHGTAPTLPDTRNPSNPAQVRAMFRSLGWAVTES